MKRSILIRSTSVLLSAALMIGNVTFARSAYADSSDRQYSADAATDTQLEIESDSQSGDTENGDAAATGYDDAAADRYDDTAADMYDDIDYGYTDVDYGADTGSDYSTATETEYRYATDTEYRDATETEYDDNAANDIMLTTLVQNGSTYEVSTAADFTSAISRINKSTDGGTISLMSDISLSTGKKIDIKKNYDHTWKWA